MFGAQVHPLVAGPSQDRRSGHDRPHPRLRDSESGAEGNHRGQHGSGAVDALTVELSFSELVLGSVSLKEEFDSEKVRIKPLMGTSPNKLRGQFHFKIWKLGGQTMSIIGGVAQFRHFS
jgi:hypothetical protein